MINVESLIFGRIHQCWSEDFEIEVAKMLVDQEPRKYDTRTIFVVMGVILDNTVGYLRSTRAMKIVEFW